MYPRINYRRTRNIDGYWREWCTVANGFGFGFILLNRIAVHLQENEEIDWLRAHAEKHFARECEMYHKGWKK